MFGVRAAAPEIIVQELPTDTIPSLLYAHELLPLGCRYTIAVCHQCFKQALWAVYTHNLFQTNLKKSKKKSQEEKMKGRQVKVHNSIPWHFPMPF